MRRIVLSVVGVLLSVSVFAASASSDTTDPSTPDVIKQKADAAMTAVTTNKTSDLQKKLHKEGQYSKNPLGILFYEPTYVLPFYYTGSPDTAVYKGNTPEDQKVMNSEFKAQFSFMLPVWQHMFNRPVSLMVSYTQLSYWQVYARSQWFRETNYEPQIFLSSNFKKNWLFNIGLDHQSNGRGGDLERSWNRAWFSLSMSRGPWLVTIQPWVLIFKQDSSDLHNPDIASYLGHERIVVAYKFENNIELSLEVRNIERMTSYMAETGAISFPLTRHLNAYVQVFNGYGQSLIEYNRHTTSAGVGLALSNWL